MRTMHRPIRPVQRIHPTEFLIVRLHPAKQILIHVLILRATKFNRLKLSLQQEKRCTRLKNIV